MSGGSGSESGPLTQLLKEAVAGDEQARERFCGRVYDELRGAAACLMQRGDHGSLQPTALVNEMLAKWLERDFESLQDIQNRRYFFAEAIDQMRKLLIDHYRKRKSKKRGGHMRRHDVDHVLDAVLDHFEQQNQFDIEALENALEKLKQTSPRQYEIVLLRFYADFTIRETAELLGVAEGTVERDWRLAKAKLYDELRGTNDIT